MPRRNQLQGNSDGASKVAVVLLPLLIVAVALAASPALLLVAERHRNQAELEGILERGTPLPDPGATGDCVFSSALAGREALFAACSPGGRDWYLLRQLAGSLVLSEVRDGLVSGQRRLAIPAGSGDLHLFRTGQHLDFYLPAAGRLGLDLPADWTSRLIDEPLPDGTSAWGMERFRGEFRQDDFMRAQFANGDGWTVEQSSFRTDARGGGEGKSANAFMLSGTAPAGRTALVRTGWRASANYTAEVTCRPASDRESYWLQAGNPDGASLAFGWNAGAGCWQLVLRPAAGAARVLGRWRAVLPPDNWSRIGLRLESPFVAEPLLDGVTLGRHVVPAPVYGQVRLGVKDGTAHFDDFQMCGRNLSLPRGTPLFVTSKAFAEKPVEASKDKDFVKWAYDTVCCVAAKVQAGGEERPATRYDLPLYGDFVYECSAELDRLLIRLADEEDRGQSFEFYRDGAAWRPGTASGRAGAHNGPLRLLCEAGRVYQESSPKVLLGTVPREHPLYLTVCAFGVPVSPDRHVVRSMNLWNDFFEEAPAAWRWWAGAFGMQYRWACQSYWNWMGGWSRNLAVCFSRDAYFGDQTIEYYVSIKDLIAGHNSRRYVRKDLNFSFCTDARDPASGYSLLFGGFDDSGTYLMKGNRVLASADTAKIPPFQGGSGDVHWRWWHIRVEKNGGRIRVFLDEQQIMDVVDQDPLPGGHLAFWTVRNGFLLARVRVAAEERRGGGPRFWCRPSDPTEHWEPVEPECVRLVNDGSRTRVVNRIGGGTFAVRWRGEPLQLTRSPILRLPFEAEPGAMVSLHLQVSGVGYLIPVTAPVEDTPAVLCPAWLAVPSNVAFEALHYGAGLAADCVLAPVMPKKGEIVVDLLNALDGRAGASPVLESLIIGNTSNKGYLLAGFAGNAPGAQYRVGSPVWLDAGAASE